MTDIKPADSINDRNDADRASTASRSRRVRFGLGTLAFAIMTAATYPIARYRIFTGFSSYDDEGYMLFSLKSFLDHGWHYAGADGYGPFYYEFWGAVCSIFGLSVNHDDGRTMTMVVWVLSSLLIGLSIWRMTGSFILGVTIQLGAFAALFSLVPEPMHPIGIIVLLLSAIMAFSCFLRDRASPFAAALLGGTVMALILIKINVGIFALAAVTLVCVVSYPALARRRWLRPLVEVGFVALPLLLMSSNAGEAWARQYALHVCAAALAVVIALRTRSVGRRDSKELWWLGGGFLLVGLTVSLALVAAGTSPSAIIDGVILQPLRLPNIMSFPLRLRSWTYVLDLLALVGALGYAYVARNREARPSPSWTWLLATLSILIGFFMAVAVISATTPYSGLDLVCFAWIALIQPPGEPNQRTRFARLLLPPLAVLLTLQAYPFAGSQAHWSALLLIPVGALSMANGVRWIAFSRGSQSARRTPLAISAVAVTVALVALVGITIKQGFDQVRAAYGGSVSLGLPGAVDVRVSAGEAANYRAVVAAIDENCKSFVMLPRMNSFYFWTRQAPPTGYDAAGWSMAYDDSAQQRAVDAIRSVDGFCLLENAALMTGFWKPLIGQSASPLERYLHHGFAPIAKFGDYQLLKREESASRS